MSHTEGAITVEADTHAPRDPVGTYGVMLRVDFNEDVGALTAGKVEKVVAQMLNLLVVSRDVGLIGKDYSVAGPGVEVIADERRRQIEDEHFTLSHDDHHSAGELARAAACYTWPSYANGEAVLPQGWPWSREWWKPTPRTPGPEGRIRELAKAGALIAAEIDRLERLEGS